MKEWNVSNFVLEESRPDIVELHRMNSSHGNNRTKVSPSGGFERMRKTRMNTYALRRNPNNFTHHYSNVSIRTKHKIETIIFSTIYILERVI